MKTLIAMLMVGMCWQASAQTKAKVQLRAGAVYCVQPDGVTLSASCQYVEKDHTNPKPPAPAFHIENGILTACCPGKWKPHWINSQQAVCRSYPQTKAAHDKAALLGVRATANGYVSVQPAPPTGGGSGELQATELKNLTFTTGSIPNNIWLPEHPMQTLLNLGSEIENEFFIGDEFRGSYATCHGVTGSYGSPDYAVHDCTLSKGHTLDEVITVMVRQMQADEKRHQDEMDYVMKRVDDIIKILHVSTPKASATR